MEAAVCSTRRTLPCQKKETYHSYVQRWDGTRLCQLLSGQPSLLECSSLIVQVMVGPVKNSFFKIAFIHLYVFVCMGACEYVYMLVWHGSTNIMGQTHAGVMIMLGLLVSNPGGRY